MVEPDVELRDVMGNWLEETGYDVLACPGPSTPDYTCVAGRGKSCPLADAADVRGASWGEDGTIVFH